MVHDSPGSKGCPESMGQPRVVSEWSRQGGRAAENAVYFDLEDPKRPGALTNPQATLEGLVLYRCPRTRTISLRASTADRK